MRHLREICVALFFWSGAGYRICMNRKRTLWSHGCKWNWSFLKPKWAPLDNRPCLVHRSLRKLLCLIRRQRNRVILCHRHHWHEPPFVQSLCGACVVAKWTHGNMDITVFTILHTVEVHTHRDGHALVILIVIFALAIFGQCVPPPDMCVPEHVQKPLKRFHARVFFPHKEPKCTLKVMQCLIGQTGLVKTLPVNIPIKSSSFWNALGDLAYWMSPHKPEPALAEGTKARADIGRNCTSGTLVITGFTF